jgi:hypothetical protein
MMPYLVVGEMKQVEKQAEPGSGGQDQFVQVRQAHPVNPAIVVDFDFPGTLK